MADPTTLRKTLKRQRQSLTDAERKCASEAAIAHILRHPRYRSAKRLAAFIGSNGELDPSPLLDHAAALDKACYLPVLHPFLKGRLWFCQWQPGQKLYPNRFNIPEPLPHWRRLIAARHLDLIVIPLLGFDKQGHRLGMGGGYYDRTLSFVNRTRHATRPFLLGFAHHSQQVAALRPNPWDVPLDAIATDKGILITHT